MPTQPIQKPADAQYDILDTLANRWSTRAFDERPVEPQTLRQLFEAARWSASTFNGQPWRFIVATQDQPESFERIAQSINENNRCWARHAPVLMLVCARRTHPTGSPNRMYQFDAGLGVQNMIIQATAMGIYARQMAGILPDVARELFEVPEEYEVLVGIAMGYPGSPDRLSEKDAEKEAQPRTRIPQEAFVFGERFGVTAPFIETTQNADTPQNET